MSERSSVAVAGDPVALALQEKCERLRRDLIRERRRLTTGTVLTAIVMVLVLGLMGTYFYIGYTKIRAETTPSKLVDYVQVNFEDNLPSWRHSIQTQVERSAPGWAADISRHGLESIPKFRAHIESYFTDQVDEMLQKTTVLSGDEFRKFLREHRPLFDKLVKDAADHKRPTETNLNDLQVALDNELQVDMQAEARDFVKNLDSVRVNLEQLAANKKLSPEQQTERRVWMLLRRMAVTGEIMNIQLQPSADEDVHRPVSTKPVKGPPVPGVPGSPTIHPKPKPKTSPKDTTKKPMDTKKK